MRILIAFFVLVASICISTHSLAEENDTKKSVGEITDKCNLPQAPVIPNGKNATKEEMLAAQKSMKAYITEGDEFLACLDNLEASWTEEEKVEKRNLVVMVHNKIVDNMTDVADLFNSALRAYKGKK